MSHRTPYNGIRSWRIALIFGLGLLAPLVSAGAQDARYIVRFKARDTAPSSRESLQKAATAVADRAIQSVDELPYDNALVLRLRLEDALQLARRPDVESLELDHKVWAFRETNDPLLSDQYSLRGQFSGKVVEAWDITTGSRNVIVAVIDTGADLKHPDLKSNIWTNSREIKGNGKDDDSNGYVDDLHGYDFVNRDGNPQDDNGHGTHVTGIVAAVGNNGAGVAGVAWDSRVIPIKALDATGNGYVSSIIRSIDYVTDLKKKGVPVTVINLSLGGGGYSEALYRAVERARNHDILIVAAAGNEGANNDIAPMYPANFAIDSVVSVAAINAQGNRATFSNFGAGSVHLAAPGSAILSTALLRTGMEYRTLSGTSMASPYVAGVLALAAAANTQLSMVQVRSALFSAVQPLVSLQGETITGGLVDAVAAAQLAIMTQPAPRLYGYVQDGTKGVRDAEVTATLTSDPSVVRTVTTGKDGSYSMSKIPLGTFTIKASKRGKKFVTTRVRVATARSVRKNVVAR